MSKEVTVEELDQAIMKAIGNSQFKVARVLTDVEKNKLGARRHRSTYV